MVINLLIFYTGLFSKRDPKKATELSFILFPSQSSSLIFHKYLSKLFFIPEVLFNYFS